MFSQHFFFFQKYTVSSILFKFEFILEIQILHIFKVFEKTFLLAKKKMFFNKCLVPRENLDSLNDPSVLTKLFKVQQLHSSECSVSVMLEFH